MRLAVLGSTGFVGGEVLRQALADGHRVVTVVRDPATLPRDAAALTVHLGTLTDTELLVRALAGSDVVLSALGLRENRAAAADAHVEIVEAVVAAMGQAGVRRLVAVSGAGITMPGERKPLGGRLVSGLVGLLARWVVRAKEREMQLIVAADLDWTLVRPTRVVPGERTEWIWTGDRLKGAATVTVGDLAAFMLSCATEGTHVREAPFITTQKT